MENNKDIQNKKRLGRGIGSLLTGSSFDGGDATDRQKQALQEQAAAKSDAATAPQAIPQAARKTLENPASIQPKVVEQKPIPAAAPTADDGRVWKIGIDKIVPGIYQPRKTFEKEKIEELAQSIRENGILQPITVRKRPAGGYEIVAGERRWRAAQAAGLHEVPSIIKSYSDKETLQLAIIENVQRQDLDPIEEAEGYSQLIKEFGYSQQDIAQRVGKDRATVANSLRLIGLTTKVKDLISQGFLTTGHAKVLLSVEDVATQEKLAATIQKKSLSVRALENLVKQIKSSGGDYSDDQSSEGPALATPNGSAMDPKKDLRKSLAMELGNQLQKKLGTKVSIQYNEGKGSVTLQFYTDDQLNQIYETICR